MLTNLSLLKKIILLVIVHVRHYWKLLKNTVLELIGYIEVRDIQSGRRYSNIMSLFPFTQLENFNLNSSNRDIGFFVISTYIDGIVHRITMHCTPIELVKNLQRIIDPADHEIIKKIDRTFYSSILSVRVSFDDTLLESDEIRGWNSNLCILKLDEDITKTEEWVRAGVYDYICSNLVPRMKKIKMDDLHLDVSTLDDMIDF